LCVEFAAQAFLLWKLQPRQTPLHRAYASASSTRRTAKLAGRVYDRMLLRSCRWLSAPIMARRKMVLNSNLKHVRLSCLHATRNRIAQFHCGLNHFCQSLLHFWPVSSFEPTIRIDPQLLWLKNFQGTPE
jgi:hypothetical protein